MFEGKWLRVAAVYETILTHRGPGPIRINQPMVSVRGSPVVPHTAYVLGSPVVRYTVFANHFIERLSLSTSAINGPPGLNIETPKEAQGRGWLIAHRVP